MNDGRVQQETGVLTIGMPVYNAESTIEDALASVLDQDIDGVRVIVSDNASTDRTAELVAAIARVDNRIDFIRQHSNLGAYRNFNFVLTLAATTYFAWAASDDKQDADYYRKCIEALESHPGAVFCHAEADETIIGQVEPFVRYEGPCGGSASTFRRYLEVHRYFPDLHVYGVFRTEVGQRIGGMDLGPSGDIAFCRKMALEGPFCYAKGTFHHRFISESWKTTHTGMNQAVAQETSFVRPSTHLLKVSRKDVFGSRLPTAQRTALAVVVTVREATRRLTVLIVGLMGKSRRARASRRLAMGLFKRFFSKGYWVVLNEEVFLQRIVWPVLRWDGR